MLERDMFLKKNKLLILVFIVIFFIKNPINANEDNLLKIINYLENFKNLSVAFVQSDDFDIQEGIIAIGVNRVRVEYNSPSKILIILSKNKAMYYNHDLNEDEFFDPRDTPAWYFYEIFKNPDFFSDAKTSFINNSLIVQKESSYENENYNILLYFENNPLLLRKIQLKNNNQEITLSIFNHKYNMEFDEKYFKLINPVFFD